MSLENRPIPVHNTPFRVRVQRAIAEDYQNQHRRSRSFDINPTVAVHNVRVNVLQQRMLSPPERLPSHKRRGGSHATPRTLRMAADENSPPINLLSTRSITHKLLKSTTTPSTSRAADADHPRASPGARAVEDADVLVLRKTVQDQASQIERLREELKDQSARLAAMQISPRGTACGACAVM